MTTKEMIDSIKKRIELLELKLLNPDVNPEEIRRRIANLNSFLVEFEKREKNETSII